MHALLKKAIEWVGHSSGSHFLTDEEYCPTRDIFHARLDSFRIQLEKNNFAHTPLLVAVTGEIGNNAFDHNIGSWRDLPGIYFGIDPKNIAVIIADRGQGITKTIRRVRPNVANDLEAIQVAFTERISGRSPEQRGNGLKFVKKVMENQRWNLELLSGTGAAGTSAEWTIDFYATEYNVAGCIAFIKT